MWAVRPTCSCSIISSASINTLTMHHCIVHALMWSVINNLCYTIFYAYFKFVFISFISWFRKPVLIYVSKLMRCCDRRRYQLKCTHTHMQCNGEQKQIYSNVLGSACIYENTHTFAPFIWCENGMYGMACGMPAIAESWSMCTCQRQVLPCRVK